MLVCLSVYLSYHNLIPYWLKSPKKVKLKFSSLTTSSPFFDGEAAGHILSIIRKQNVDRKLVHAKTTKAFPCVHILSYPCGFLFCSILSGGQIQKRDSTAPGSIFYPHHLLYRNKTLKWETLPPRVSYVDSSAEYPGTYSIPRARSELSYESEAVLVSFVQDI